MNEKPIFIIGPPRSGTTLLATMLNSHSRVFLANESKVFVKLLPKNKKYTLPLGDHVAQKIISQLEQMELYYLAPLPSSMEFLQQINKQDLPTFLRAFFEAIASREGKTRWGDKTAVAYRQLPLIRSCFPDAIFLGLERDPYEIAASYVKINPKWGALGAMIHWIDFKRAVFQQGEGFDIHMVSYKRLVEDPEPTLKEVCKYVGEDFENAMLDFHKTDRARSLAVDKTYEGAAKPLYKSQTAPPDLLVGVTGYLVKKLIKLGPEFEVRPKYMPPIYLSVKSWVYFRAALWELRQRLSF